MAMASFCFSPATRACPTRTMRVNRHLAFLRSRSLRIDIALTSHFSQLRHGFSKDGIRICSKSIDSADLLTSASTMKALKDLGLDVTKGCVTTELAVIKTKFFIMRMLGGRKVEEPDMLEKIRLTIISNLLQYLPESSEQLAMGEFFGIKPPEKKLDVDVVTHVHVEADGPKRSLLYIETADRHGLLEIYKILTDTNIDVEYAEIRQRYIEHYFTKGASFAIWTHRSVSVS